MYIFICIYIHIYILFIDSFIHSFIYLFIVVAPLGKSNYWCSINPKSVYTGIFASHKEDVFTI